MNRERLNWFFGSLGERKLLSATLVLFTLAAGILIGTMISTEVNAAKETPAAPEAKPLVIPDPVPLSNEFSKIAERIRPSVVNIHVEQLPRRAESGRPEQDRDGMEDFFRRFFGLPGGPGGGGENFPGPDRRRPGEGSGVIVDEHGYIITNRHVVEDVDRVRVRLVEDDQLYDAKMIGSDQETDIAVIKIDAGRKLTPAVFGNAAAVAVGDWALAVGSPFGYRESVTVGIISAKSREVQSGVQRPFQKFLQTDAAINPGNSGGPLVNIRGEVIGINTAIVTRSGGYEGLGFALASNIAAEVYNKIIQYGKVPRGSIGISFRPHDPALLRKYGAPDGGVFVEQVRPSNGPAARAGVKPEDVIVEINGHAIRDGDQLIDLVAAIPIGTKVPVVVVRNDNRHTLEVEIADRAELFSDELSMAALPEEKSNESAEVLFGISVRNLTAADREELSYEGEDGVLVTDVEPASFADDIGLRPRDIIVAINREPVSSLSDVRGIQDTLKPGDDVVFKVMSRAMTGRGGQAVWSPRYPAGQLRVPKDDL